MNKNNIGIGLFGFGNIGAGVIRTLAANGEVITRNTGLNIKLLKVVDVDITTDRGVAVDKSTLSTRAEDIIDNPGISIVIELIGGAKIAKTVVERSLAAGKSVVTANKELMAKHGPELLELAQKHGVKLLFEASVGGGIPILTPLLTCLRANRINRLLGIVNGTTNYILTQMADTGRDFSEILEEAQAKGFAEADPTNDIEGHDAAYKTVVLCSVGFGKRIEVSDVYREGITRIALRDIQDARALGYAIKLLSISENTKEGILARVHPALVPLSHPLANINGVLNAVYVEGAPIGPLMFVGRGAGPHATSSAVLGDVIAAACGNIEGRPAGALSPAKILSIDNSQSSFYIRMAVADRPGVLAEVSHIFGHEKVSIGSLRQTACGETCAEIVWLTHPTPEKSIRAALKKIEKLDCVNSIDTVIRVVEG